jgi:hypothetical protein
MIPGASPRTHDDDERRRAGVRRAQTATRGKGRKARGGAGATTTRKRKARANGDGGNDPEQDGAKIAKDAKISDDNALFSMHLPTPGCCCTC